MEGYRSYPEERRYPDSPDPGYAEGYPEVPGRYGDRPPEPRRYDEPRYDEPRGYDDLRRDQPEPGRPPPPSPRSSSPPGTPISPYAASPGPVPGEEPSVSRRQPAPSGPPAASGLPAASGPPAPAGDGVYRSRRPGAAVLAGVPAVLLEIPALLLLYHSVGDQSPSGVVAASCLILGFPLLALGLYAVATGAVRAAGPNSIQAWLRPPVAYLSVALMLFLAAGLAA